MKHHLFVLFAFILFSFFQSASAQAPVKPKKRCSTYEYYRHLFKTNPIFKQQFEQAQNAIALRQSTQLSLRTRALADTIAVVVHVIGSDSMQALMTDAIIQSQMDVLNEDFKGLNSDSVRIPPAFKPLFGKSGIHFMLAGTNPFGEPATGIVRRQINRTFNDFNFDEAKQTDLGGNDAWDPASYLNIWVVDFGTNPLIGISVFPGDPNPLNLHGFISDYRVFGRGAPFHHPQYNKGRTTTHEIGHFFNLYHIWGDDNGACTGTDFPGTPSLDDTPNQAEETYGNPDPEGTGRVLTDICTQQPSGIMYQNFMDYTNDSAMALFTKGQQARMETTLTVAPDRSPLLFSTAYAPAPVYARDTRIRLIRKPADNSFQCLSVSPVVVLRNSSKEPLTAVQIVAVLNNAQPVVYNWTGNLSPYTETDVTLSFLTAVTGENTLKIYTRNPNGQADENRANDTSAVSFRVLPPVSLERPFEEGFDRSVFPPEGWQLYNPNNDITWEHNPTIGYRQPGSAWFNDWNNASTNRYDDLTTPGFTYSNVDSVFLHFRLAAATYSDPGNTNHPVDTLTLLLSKDCGNTYTTIYKKWGAELQTLNDPGFPATDEFFPASPSQWRRDSVNLGLFLGTSEPQFNITFRISGNFDNNVFIDDVTLYIERVPPLLKQQGYLVLPTAFRQQFAVWHYQQPTDLRSLAVYNTAGQLVWRQEYRGKAEKIITVNLQQQPAGVYFVQLGYDARRTITQRVVKY